jgi:hypothetical protein
MPNVDTTLAVVQQLLALLPVAYFQDHTRTAEVNNAVA